jgi:hypothetical protein
MYFNSRGFRAPEWSLPSFGQRPRLVLVGDSFVEGWGAAQDDTIGAVMGRLARREKVQVEIISLGRGGNWLAHYLALIRNAIPVFEPQDLFLVLYMNDLYQVPDAAPLFLKRRVPRTASEPGLWRTPAALRVWLRQGMTWSGLEGFFDGSPEPYAVDSYFEERPARGEQLKRVVDPELVPLMLEGKLNPSLANALRRSELALSRPVTVKPLLEALKRFFSGTDTTPWIVYLPSLNQVSDAYREAQLRLSEPTETDSLTGAPFQAHARSLSIACRELDLPFLDLTPVLRRAEDQGQRLYWPYDSHMNAAGYDLVAHELYRWWRSSSQREEAPGS